MSSIQDWLGLQGKVCVVTGAASGIGAAVASGLAAVTTQTLPCKPKQS